MSYDNNCMSDSTSVAASKDDEKMTGKCFFLLQERVSMLKITRYHSERLRVQNRKRLQA